MEVQSEMKCRNGLYGFEFREPDERRKPVGERKTYDIKQLWQRNHEIVNLAARGFKGTEIAEILNINPQTVSNTLNSELGQCKLSDIRLERDDEAKVISKKIKDLTAKALDTYHKIFDDKSGELSLKDKGTFATSFLNEMSGLRAPTKIQSQSVHTTLTVEELEEFKKRGIEAARASGLVVEVDDEGRNGSRPNAITVNEAVADNSDNDE
jgi:DNA-binding CsgD family transcriptional regulator